MRPFLIMIGFLSVSLAQAQETDAGALVLDLSPAFRYEPDVPLLIAGVNDEHLGAARERNIVAAADAATVQLLLALILMCFNFLGDGLRDLFDARQSE